MWRCLRRAFWPSLAVCTICVVAYGAKQGQTLPEPGGSLHPLAVRAAGLTVEVEIYGYNTNLIHIPDCAGSTPGHAVSRIDLTGAAPDGAVVTRLRYCCRIEHDYLGDLIVRLTNDSGSQQLVWDYPNVITDDGHDDDAQEDNDIDMEGDGEGRWVEGTFDGDAINQRWHLDVQDRVEGNVGFIDYFDLKVYYESDPQLSATPTPSLTNTHTRTRTPTRTLTSTRTSTSTRTPTPTRTWTPTGTPTLTQRPSETPTRTPTPDATRTGTATCTASPTPTCTQPATSMPTQTPSLTSETPGALYLPCILMPLR
jgi:subtilisin-like proprotein convertase family protein